MPTLPNPGAGRRRREKTYARNADEGRRAAAAQTSQQKRDWLERRRQAAAEAYPSRTQGRGPAIVTGTGQDYLNRRRGRTRAGGGTTGQVWPDEAQRRMAYGESNTRTVRRPQYRGKKQVYPWPDEAARAAAMTAWQGPPTGADGGPGEAPFTGGSSYQSGYGGGGYGGGGYGGGGGPGYGNQRYSYLPEWLAKMAQWNI